MSGMLDMPRKTHPSETHWMVADPAHEALMQEAQAEFLGLDPGTEPLRGREKRALAWGSVAISLSSPQKQGTAHNLQAPFTNIPPCYRCSGDGITPSRLA